MFSLNLSVYDAEVAIIPSVHMLPNGYELPQEIKATLDAADMVAMEWASNSESDIEDFNSLRMQAEISAAHRGNVAGEYPVYKYLQEKIFEGYSKLPVIMGGVERLIAEYMVSLGRPYLRSLETANDHAKACGEVSYNMIQIIKQILPEGKNLVDMGTEFIDGFASGFASSSYCSGIVNGIEALVCATNYNQLVDYNNGENTPSVSIIARNTFMADALITMAKENPGKRIVAIVGYSHILGGESASIQSKIDELIKEEQSKK